MAGTAAKDTAVDPVPPPHGTRTLHEGRFLALRQRGRWEFVQRTNAFGAAVVVALTDADEIVLVEQYREPLQCRCIENPAGLAGDQPGEDDILAAAGRELLEETGFEAAKLEFLMAGPSAPGMADEMLSFVRASGLRRTGPGGGDGAEDITVHVVPMARAAAFLAGRMAAGLHVDPRVYAALFLARWQPDGRAVDPGRADFA